MDATAPEVRLLYFESTIQNKVDRMADIADEFSNKKPKVSP
jgi:hypothetical protein